MKRNNAQSHRGSVSSSKTGPKARKLLTLGALLWGLAVAPAAGQLALPENDDSIPPSLSRPQATDARPAPKPKPEPDPDQVVSFGIFSEPIELATLIDFVGNSLGINIAVKGEPEGKVVFNAPVVVPKNRLIDLLDAMLDQFNFTITHEPDTGFYIVQPTSELRPTFGEELGTTRIIETPNIKPSLLVPPLMAMLAGPSAAAGQSGQNASNAIQAIDELGVLIINARSRDIRRLEEMVERLIAIDKDQRYIRFELDHLAAPTALNRVVGLVGGSAGAGIGISQAGNNNRAGGQGGGATPLTLEGATLSNIGDRITIDPQGNALIFRGTEKEIERVRDLLSVIDVPNTLEPRNYFAGASAAQIADIAKRRGLGEVIQIEDPSAAPTNIYNFNNQNRFNTDTDESQGGPVMVVDSTRGNIIYYGTPDQQAQLAALLEELKTEDERVVMRDYPLDHTDALDVAELLNAIIKGETQTGESALLQGTSGRANRFINGFPVFEGESPFDPDKITITADEFNNQVIVNAPIKQQEEIEKVIQRLDQQRAQVYIEALIVSVADNEDFTLAFESQINAGSYSGGTSFGLSSPGDSFQDPRNVATSLGGLTHAVIYSDYVPIIMHATQTNNNVRILSTPQLLVNDNEESEIVSIEEQPYSEITQGTSGADNLQGLGGYVEAGTTLRVTPSISKAGFIRMEYYVELSNFVGQGTDTLPPATNRRTVEGSATVPSNATIVLGGITVEDVRDTVLKVPLIGDIPLVGELFKRTNKVNNASKLYVFITPRIMTDPNFNDLKLFSRGPQADMEIDDNLPEMEPEIIDIPVRELPIGLPEDTDDANAPTMQPEPIEIGASDE